MNEKRTRRRQCAGTLGECEEKNAGRNHRRTRARVSRRVGGDTTSFCAPKTDSLLPLFPIRRESPKQRKRKNGIGILRVGTPSPQRSATTTASFSSSDDHSPRNRFRVSRSRSHRPPTSRIWSMAPDFFFSALDTTKENALIQHISSRGESLAPKRPVRERRKPAGRVRSRRFCFSRRKKTHHFSLLLGLLLLLLLLLLLCGGSCTRFVWRSKCVTFWGEKR